ncbi:MAG TPA: PAS domain S-box protein [Sphingobacteriaceae bacterium]
METIKVLILEHDPNDLELLQYALRKSDLTYTSEVVANKKEYEQALVSFDPDIILSDYSLPSFDGLTAYCIKQKVLPNVPFIVVSGTIGEENAVELIKMGITDYVLKEKMYQVIPKIQRALREAAERAKIKQAEREIADRNERIENILESITEGFIALDNNWRVTYWNKTAEDLLGRKREDIMGKYVWDEYENATNFYSEYQRVIAEQTSSVFEEYFAPLGKWIQVSAYPSKDGISIFFRDITESRRQEAMRRLENEVLELYTKPGSSIEETIEHMLNGVKEIHPELLCSTLKVKNGKLFYWAFSHLPKSFIDETDGRMIAIGEGTCGTAALMNRKVVVTDIASGTLLPRYMDIAEKYGIRASISYPFNDPYRNVLGTFSVCLKTARDLSEAEEKTLETVKQILQHILENHIAETALKESEEKYSRLFNENPMPMWVFDPDTLGFLSVNEAAIRHYGYSREEFMNMTIRDIRPKDSVKKVERTVTASKEIGSVYQGVFDHLKKNGELIKVAINGSAIPLGEKMARLVLVNDITEKLRAEKAIELSEKRFKALVQEGSDLISVMDLNGNYKYASPALVALIGADPERISEVNGLLHVHPGDRKRVADDLVGVAAQKRAQTAPFRFKAGNGEYRWLEFIGTNLLDDPAINGIVVNSKDVTERINYIQAIESQNSRLREIAWIQSHIVRAPLARIMGLIDLVKNYQGQYDSQAELLEHILTSAHELDDVIRQIVKKTERVKTLEDENQSISS